MAVGSQFGTQLKTPGNYRRGSQDNIDCHRTLQRGACKDNTCYKALRGLTSTSRQNLTHHRGENPVETVQTEVQKLQDQGVNQDAIDKYVQPYVDRVVRQQRPKGLQAAAEAGVGEEVEPETGLSHEHEAEMTQADEDLGKRLTAIFKRDSLDTGCQNLDFTLY